MTLFIILALGGLNNQFPTVIFESVHDNCCTGLMLGCGLQKRGKVKLTFLINDSVSSGEYNNGICINVAYVLCREHIYDICKSSQSTCTYTSCSNYIHRCSTMNEASAGSIGYCQYIQLCLEIGSLSNRT